MTGPTHLLNWQLGWWLLLFAFVTGAGIGLVFHRDDFLGGYGSFRRRIVRLGTHRAGGPGDDERAFRIVALAAAGDDVGDGASIGFVVGGVAMPAVCFLTGWRGSFRHCSSFP